VSSTAVATAGDPRPGRGWRSRALTGLALAGAVAILVAVFIATGSSSTHPAGPPGGPTHKAASVSSAATSIAPTTAPTPTTTTAPVLAAAITAENRRPGTPGWTVQHPSVNGQIEGYASTVSAQQGDTVTLYVTSTAATWTATAFRMGWYGGILARQVWQSTPQPGVRQSPATRDPVTSMVSAPWAPSLRVPITAAWPPGDYLFKLVSSDGWDSYIPLTVRNDASHAPILIINSVTTWQAYNLWGGYDLYSGRPPVARATVVTFDRPYELGNGSGDFLGNEERLVKLVEKEGLDVTYTTDVDIDEHPSLLLNHRVVVSLGHDEYYSLVMRDAMAAARDHGVNLVFLGANAVYRHIRLQPSSLGPDRVEVNYRVASLDPEDGRDDADVTVQWRNPPNNRPESSLLGEMYECNPVLDDLVVTDPTAWIYAGTGLTPGAHLPDLVGSEYDHYSTSNPQPPGNGVQIMAASPVVCRGVPSTSDLTYYVAPSGAGVIDSGTNLWVPSILSDRNVSLGAYVAQITLTMLRQAAMGPLGLTHPAVPTGLTATATAPPPLGE